MMDDETKDDCSRVQDQGKAPDQRRLVQGERCPDRQISMSLGRDDPIFLWQLRQIDALVIDLGAGVREQPGPVLQRYDLRVQHGMLGHELGIGLGQRPRDRPMQRRQHMKAVGRIQANGTVDMALPRRLSEAGLQGAGARCEEMRLDWSTMTHNPFVEVTKDTTTL